MLTCYLLKLLHTGSYDRSIVFTDADKSEGQDKDTSWYAIIYVLRLSFFITKVNVTGKQHSSVALLGFFVLAREVLSNRLQAHEDVMRLVEEFA